MTKTQLPAVTKTFSTTFVGGPDSGRTRKECWGAKTVDGRWAIQRIEVPGTPWEVYELVDGKPVRLAGSFGTLRRALVAIAAGQCETVQFLAHLGQWVTVDGMAVTGRYATEAAARSALGA